MGQSQHRSVSRREFLATSATATAATIAAPAALVASKTGAAPIAGEGEHRFEVIHDFL